jgi:hypothetical protein
MNSRNESNGCDYDTKWRVEMNYKLPQPILVSFSWITVSGSNQEDWPFLSEKIGKRISKDLREKIKGPQVYRFYFIPKVGMHQCYIGESEIFEERCRKYVSKFRRLSKSKPVEESTLDDLDRADNELQTDPTVRVGAMIQNWKRDGISVELQMIDFDEFTFNGALISRENMSNPYKRKAIENLAILDSDVPNIHIMNSDRDVNSKWFSDLLKRNAEKWDAT